LAFPRPLPNDAVGQANGLMAGWEKTKTWLPARHVVQAGSYPRTEKRRGLSPDKRCRGLYSEKIVFGISPKTILGWV